MPQMHALDERLGSELERFDRLVMPWEALMKLTSLWRCPVEDGRDDKTVEILSELSLVHDIDLARRSVVEITEHVDLKHKHC